MAESGKFNEPDASNTMDLIAKPVHEHGKHPHLEQESCQGLSMALFV